MIPSQYSQEFSSNNNSETKEEVIDTNEGEETWAITYWAENKGKKNQTSDKKKKNNRDPA